MEKRIVVLLIALALCGSFAFGDSFAKNGMLVAPGNMNANIGAAYGWGVGVVGGFEYPIGKFEIAKLPFTYGAAARGSLYFGSALYLGVGGYGTLHFSLAALDLPNELSWLDNFDIYEGLGIGFGTYVGSLGFGWLSGVSYYFQKNLAVYAEGGYIGSGVGIIFKL